MAWYNDPSGTLQFLTYNNDAAADKDMREAVKYGWRIRDISADAAQVPFGAVMTKFANVTGLGILFGVNGTSGKLSVTWEREGPVALLVSEEDKTAVLKQEYDAVAQRLYAAVRKVEDIQSRNPGGPRSSDVAKALGDALTERSRAALARQDVCMRMARQVEVLLAAHANAGEAAPPSLDIVGWMIDEATAVATYSAQDDAAAAALQQYALACRDTETGVKAAQDAARNLSQGVMRIAEAERRALQARDDVSRSRAEEEAAQRKVDQERAQAYMAQVEADRDAKEASRAAMQATLPAIPTY
jgi:hypothetical protein